MNDITKVKRAFFVANSGIEFSFNVIKKWNKIDQKPASEQGYSEYWFEFKNTILKTSASDLSFSEAPNRSCSHARCQIKEESSR